MIQSTILDNLSGNELLQKFEELGQSVSELKESIKAGKKTKEPRKN